MIVRFFDSGKSNGQSPINYLLGDKDHTGQTRAVKPEVLEGIPHTTIGIINNIDRQYKYSSGVIAFRDEEKPTKQQLHHIIDRFRETFMPGLSQEHFNDLWVMHRDKGNTELHFIIPMEEMTTGKQLNIMPPGQKAIQHKDLFTKVINQEYGWKQVVQNPLDMQLTDFETKAPNGNKQNTIKNHIAKHLKANILNGSIKSRADLIQTLNNKGLQVTRQGNDYISVKLPGIEKARRFKGEIFKADANYPELIRQYEERQNNQTLTKAEYQQVKEKLSISTAKRTKFNTDVYLSLKSKKSLKNKSLFGKVKRKVSDVKKNHTSDNKHEIPKTEEPKSEIKIASPSEIKEQVKQNQKNESSNSVIADTDSGGGGSEIGLEIQIANLNGSLQKLQSQLASELDPKKQSALRMKIYRIKQQLEAVGVQLREAKRKFNSV